MKNIVTEAIEAGVMTQDDAEDLLADILKNEFEKEWLAEHGMTYAESVKIMNAETLEAYKKIINRDK